MLRFTCECGRSLKAPEKLAGKKSRCPACGEFVSIPSAASPLTAKVPVPANSEAIESEYAFAVSAQPPQGPSEMQDQSTGICGDSLPPGVFASPLGKEVDPNAAAPTRRERFWFESWCYPLAGFVFLCALSAGLTLMTVIGTALYPAVLKYGTSWINGLFLISGWSVAMVAIVGHGCRYLEAILRQGLSGGVDEVTAPDYDIDLALTHAVRWSVTLVNGPMLLFCCAFYYWLHCGDLTPLDALILGELIMPAITYWMLSVVVLGKKPDLGRARPQDVLAMLRKLGPRALIAGMAATAAAMGHLYLAATSLSSLHQGNISGLFILGMCWFSAWYCAAFLLRVVGLWHFYARRSGAIAKNATMVSVDLLLRSNGAT